LRHSVQHTVAVVQSTADSSKVIALAVSIVKRGRVWRSAETW